MKVLASNGSADSWPSCPKAAGEVPISSKKNKNRKAGLVFKSNLFYKDLFFRVFNIINIENELNVKYKTKNIKTDPDDVFFAILNQMIVKNNSSRNFKLKETRVCIAWL